MQYQNTKFEPEKYICYRIPLSIAFLSICFSFQDLFPRNLESGAVNAILDVTLLHVERNSFNACVRNDTRIQYQLSKQLLSIGSGPRQRSCNRFYASNDWNKRNKDLTTDFRCLLLLRKFKVPGSESLHFQS